MKLTLGGAQFGLDYGFIKNKKIKKKEIYKIKKLAKKFKVSFIDTAISYNDSESIIGNNKLNNFKIITKIKLPNKGISDFNEWSSKIINQSLLNLRVNKIYAVLFHDYKDLLSTNGEEFLNSLIYLKKKNLFSKIGISIYSPDELDAIWKLWKPDLVQVPFNIFDQRIVRSGWLNKLKTAKIEIFVRSCFLQGLLLGNYNNHNYFKPYKKEINSFFNWCKKKKISNLKACIHFVKQYSKIDNLIVGFQNSEQFKKILNIFAEKQIKVPNIFNCNKINLIDPRKWH
jgi:aryl-alcohol dehydrogenase-like predicted oxidoreductase